MAAMDHFPVIEADDLFYAGVRRRLLQAVEADSFSLVPRLFGNRLAPALLITMVLLNAATAWFALRHRENGTDREQYIESFADQYLLGVSSFVPSSNNDQGNQ